MKRVLGIFFLFLGINSIAQDNIFFEAGRKYEDGKYDEAFELYEKAGNEYRLQNEFAAYSQCNLYMSNCLSRIGDHKYSLQLSLNTYQYIQENLNTNKYLVAESERIVGEALMQTGKNEKAVEFLKNAKKNYPDSANLERAQCYNSLGVAYWNNGNRETSRIYHDQALAIRKELFGNNSLEVADSYNNIGLLYIDDNGLDASLYFNRALKIYREKLGELHPKVAYALINLARAQAQQNLFTQAFSNLDMVDGIWDNLYQGDHPAKAFTLSTRGQFMLNNNQIEKALNTQELALQMYLRLYGPKHPEVANTHFLIGNIHLQNTDYKLGLESYQNSIYSNMIDQEYQTLYDLPKLKGYFNGDFFLTYLLAKAKALEALHFEKTLKPKHLKSAIVTYQKADTLVNELRKIRITENDKIQLGEKSRLIYANGIRLTAQLAQQPIIGSKYNDLLFNLFERSKSAVLLSAIQDTNAKKYSGIPDRLLLVEDSLKNEITYIQQKLAEGTKSQLLSDNLFQLKNKYQQFIEELEVKYPRYYELKYQSNITSLEGIQNSLGEEANMLFYFMNDSLIFRLQVSSKKLSFENISLESDFLKKISSFRNSLIYQLEEEFRKVSEGLYEVLIPKDLSKKTIFLTDGRLSTIPFEALRNPKTGQYLIEETEVAYDFSASLFLAKNKEEFPYENEALLIAPIIFNEFSNSFKNLPATESEINKIKYQLISKNIESQIYLKSQATEKVLGEIENKSYKYVHMATHGVVETDNPDLSRIYLYPDSESDGLLYSGEIYNKNLNADLVTLSACETGLGKLASGEGIIGLSRSLTYAGAKNQIVSLWQVADQSTAELMIDFYKVHLGFSDPLPYSESLQKAKMNMIRSEKFSFPYYWAPFILIGN